MLLTRDNVSSLDTLQDVSAWKPEEGISSSLALTRTTHEHRPLEGGQSSHVPERLTSITSAFLLQPRAEGCHEAASFYSSGQRGGGFHLYSSSQPSCFLSASAGSTPAISAREKTPKELFFTLSLFKNSP